MRRGTLALQVIALTIGAMPWHEAPANPTGPTPVRGVASISGLGTSSLTVTTNNAKAIINWQSFSLGPDDITRFKQPSATAAVLNRVTSTQVSDIVGLLASNGRVFLVNPNGIFFSFGHSVDVAGLVASSLNISDSDFISGRMRFTATPGAPATRVVLGDAGTVRARNGGIYAIGQSVSVASAGRPSRVVSPDGDVVLAAGTKVEVLNPATPDVTVIISAGPANRVRVLGDEMGGGFISGARISMFAGMIDIGAETATRATAGPNGTVTLRATGDIRVGREVTGFQFFVEHGPQIAANKRVEMIADGHITISCPGCIVPGQVQGGDIFLEANNITEGTSTALLGRSLTIAANGNVNLGSFSNSIARFGGTASGNLVFNNTSPTLTVPGLRVENSHSLSLTQQGNLAIKGNVTSGAQTISATGNVLVTPGSTGGITVHAEGPQSIRSGGDMIIQGGATRGAFALVSSSDDIDLTVGGTLRLNSGRVPQARARVQTEDRRSTITLHFPNLSSGGWFVNDREGAIRRGQSGFLSGNGAAVRGKTLVVDHAP